MDIIFKKTNAQWVKYSEYEYVKGEDGHIYLIPTPTAKPSIYDPFKEAETLVVDALNLGRLAMNEKVTENVLKEAVMEFVGKYGLLGFMTALPTTPEFVDYDAVYLPKNQFIREETMATLDYISIFFPFNKPDIYKDKTTFQWNVNSRTSDKSQQALAMTYSNESLAMGLCLQRIYAEKFDWLVAQFRDWAFILVSAFLFYTEKEVIDNFTRNLYRKGVSAFGGKAPTYHISLYDDKPRIVWDFHSLIAAIQSIFGFALTNENRPLRICKHCNLAFITEHTDDEFCKSCSISSFNDKE